MPAPVSRTLVLSLLLSMAVGCTTPFEPVSIRPIWGYEDGCIVATVGGAGFEEDGFHVTFDGVAATHSWPEGPLDQGFQAQVEVPAHAPGPVAVEVSSGGVTKAIGTGFTYVLCDPSPRVDFAGLFDADGVPLDYAVLDGGGELLVIEGCGFGPGTTVSINGAPVADVTIDCSTTLTVPVPSGTAYGTATVEITHDLGTNTDVTFDYNCEGMEIDGVDPALLDPQVGGTVTVTGCGYWDDGTVHTRAFLDVPDPGVDPLAGEEVVVTVLDPWTLTLDLPIHDAGSASLTLVNPDPADPSGNTVAATTTRGDAIAFADPIVIDAVAPDSGAVAGGFRVDLYGSGFPLLPELLWAGEPVDAADVEVIDPTHITLHGAPPGAGIGPIGVVISDGTQAASTTFYYTE